MENQVAPVPVISRSAQEVGFWYNNYDGQDLPVPVAQLESWDGQEEFLTKLKSVEERLLAGYQKIVDHYNTQIDLPREQRTEMANDRTVVAYRGYSPCRCCGKSNGSREFHYEGWVWPAGYMHYLRDHNVLPDEGFKNFILNL